MTWTFEVFFFVDFPTAISFKIDEIDDSMMFHLSESVRYNDCFVEFFLGSFGVRIQRQFAKTMISLDDFGLGKDDTK